jgi:hypothetical protein
MSAIDGFLPRPIFARLFLLGSRPDPSPQAAALDDDRSRRDAVLALMRTAPDACTSEAGFEAMMSVYPGRF